ncbi:MAG: ABC transporter permease [Candidatus Planktophila sp.]|jgi:ribose transport system permease protein|nr:ABC transporter permease [Candidatus Planktophila sp.]
MAERTESKSRRFKLPEEASVIFALLLLIAIVGTLRPIFLKPENLLNLAASYAISALLAGCIVYLLSMGEIDLSFGWILNLSAVIAGVSMIAGVPVWIAIIIGIIAGGVMGAINGVLTVVMRLPLIIVTLGTASVYQGISLITNKSGSVVPTDEKITTNIFFRALGGDIETPIPIILIFVVLAFVVLHLVLHKTRFGYRILAIGSNPEAARLAGIPIKQTKILVCALMGFVSGIGGVLFLGFRGAVDPTTGANLLLPVVAAAIIGGTALSGGAGTVWGSLYGALIVGVIGVGVVFLGIDAVWSTLVTGLVILFAIGVDQIVRVRKNRAG